MAALVWDEVGTHIYETGVDHCVLYRLKDTITDPTDPYMAGVAWNGITNISESSSGGEPTALWADNIKYLNLISAEEASLTIEAYTYPEEFEECDGTRELVVGVNIRQQARKQFGLCYRTRIGNDQKSDDYGYKIHIAYGCFASPSDRGYATVNDSPEAISFSWSVSTTPVDVNGFKPTALLTIDSTKTTEAKMTAIKNILYGTANADAKLPLPAEILSTMS